MTFRQKLYHFLYGLHSNIPPCCIHYFLSEWWWMSREQRQTIRSNTFGGCGYVPCPDCSRQGKLISVHICQGKKCADLKRRLDEMNNA